MVVQRLLIEREDLGFIKMPKKCYICEEPAVYQIKGTANYYCKKCAKELFNDTKLLLKIEEEAKKLKKFIENSVL